MRERLEVQSLVSMAKISRATSIREIASRARVSIATVSRTLNAPDQVRPETARRVREVLKELDYSPNLAARALVTGRTNLIGLVVPNLVHSFFGEIAQSLSRVLQERGYGLLICSSDEDPVLERQTLIHLLARKVDVLLIATVQQGKEIFPPSMKPKTPYILIDRKIQGLAANFVGIDDEEVGFLATEHLVQVGCKRIAHIGGVRISTAGGRLEGYLRALKKYRMEIGSEYVVFSERMDVSADVAAYNSAKKLLALKPRPDGIFCYNDPCAMGAMRAVLDSGLSIPKHVALIGSGNLHVDADLRVPLSTVDQQSQELGRRAAMLALDLLQGHDENTTIILKPKLVVRESSRKQK